MKIKSVTLGEIRSELEGLLKKPDDTLVTLGGGDLTWYRIKNRGPITGQQVVQIEFNEIYSVTSSADDA